MKPKKPTKLEIMLMETDRQPTLHEKLEAQLMELTDRVARLEELLTPEQLEKLEEEEQITFPKDFF